LIGLQEGVVDEQTTFMCHHGFSYAAGRFMKCHGFGPHQLNNGIYNSCNTYFNVMKTINKYVKPSYAVDVGDHLKSFGLGDFMGYDLPTGKEEIYLIQNVQTHVPERRMEIPQSYPTLLDRVKSS
jgi:penicillin-binding protein 2